MNKQQEIRYHIIFWVLFLLMEVFSDFVFKNAIENPNEYLLHNLEFLVLQMGIFYLVYLKIAPVTIPAKKWTYLILALIFQPAHVIEETNFFTPAKTGSMENNWAIHQLLTTANFANGSRLFSWLIGGLNFQIEHHLFPNICHIHYKSISKIVKKTAQDYDIPYYEHKTFYGAIKSHFSLLNQLGTGSYDKKLAAN